MTFDVQYGIPFYLQYLAHWPEYFIVAEAPGGELMGYSKYLWHSFKKMADATFSSNKYIVVNNVCCRV